MIIKAWISHMAALEYYTVCVQVPCHVYTIKFYTTIDVYVILMHSSGITVKAH